MGGKPRVWSKHLLKCSLLWLGVEQQASRAVNCMHSSKGSCFSLPSWSASSESSRFRSNFSWLKWGAMANPSPGLCFPPLIN
jgi:hypothetical protein